MIDHDAARRTGAIDIDFELEPDERADLDGHLRSCAACRAFMADLATDATRLSNVDLGPVPVAVRADIAIVAERRGRGGRSTPVLLAAAILVLVVVGGAAIGVGAPPRPAAGPEAAPPVGRAVHWSTDVVDLAADDLWLEVGGQVVIPPDDREIKISSDAGTPQKWTLEVAWNAGRTEMRINLYFVTDADGWRVDEARTYDGRVPSDWLETSEVAIGAPAGAAFGGDIDLTLPDRSGPDTGPGRLVMRGLRLATRSGGLAPIPPGAKPPLIDKDPPPAPPIKIACGPLDQAACTVWLKDAVRAAATNDPGRTIVDFTVDADGLGWTLTLDDGSAITMAATDR